MTSDQKKVAVAALDRVLQISTPTKIADACGIKRPNINAWDIVPAHHVLKVEKLTGVSRYDLRPDVFGEPEIEKKTKELEAA